MLGPYLGLSLQACPCHPDYMSSRGTVCWGSWFWVLGGQGLTSHRVKVPGIRAALQRLECAACPRSSPKLCLGSGFKIKSFPQVRLAKYKPGALSRTIKKPKQRNYYVSTISRNNPFIYLFESFLYWGAADYQRCDTFRWTAEGLNHTHTCPHSPQTPLPSRLPYDFEQSSLLYSRTLLAAHFKYSSSVQVDPQLPNYPLPSSFPLATISSLSKSMSICFVNNEYLI